MVCYLSTDIFVHYRSVVYKIRKYFETSSGKFCRSAGFKFGSRAEFACVRANFKCVMRVAFACWFQIGTAFPICRRADSNVNRMLHLPCRSAGSNSACVRNLRAGFKFVTRCEFDGVLVSNFTCGLYLPACWLIFTPRCEFAGVPPKQAQRLPVMLRKLRSMRTSGHQTSVIDTMPA